MDDAEVLAKKQQRLAAAKRLLAYSEAHDSLLRYIQLQMPDPEHPGDTDFSRYEVTPQARLLCEVMEQVEAGRLKRVAVSIGPQLGKSEIITRAAPAWISGRNRYRNLMVGTYNDTFASEFGEEVRTRVQASTHQAVFKGHDLRKGAVDLLISEEGGKTAFVGVGGSGTGKPADFFIVDDPIRSDADAQSPTYRERIWKWFNSVVFTRCHGKSSVVVVQTRWHVDDLIGRLCDPDHPERNKMYAGIAEEWTYINLPAVVENPKLAKVLGLNLEVPKDPKVISMFGSKPMSALWPERKPLGFLAEAKRMDARTFNALYMGRPTPDDGEYFKSDWLVEYQAHELPTRLRMYGASDHAVSVKQDRDYTVIGCVGVDEHEDIWVLPDVRWDRIETDKTVEEILYQMKAHKPELWWMESELISKSFGPFLHKRREEEKLFYTTIVPVTVSKDKAMRARSIEGRMSMKKVRFPAFASWWSDAKAQILRFPYGANDDFVDWLSHIGMGLIQEIRPSRPELISSATARIGSPQWIMQQSLLRARGEKRVEAVKGW